MTDAEKIRAWLANGLDNSGLSVADLARLSGVHKSTIFRALSDDYAFVPSSRTLAKLADALQASIELPARKLEPLRVQTLHTPYELSPTYWVEHEGAHQDISGGSQIVPHPSIPASEQWVGRMRGDSMAPEYLDGDDLHVANFRSLKFPAREGDHVAIRRWRKETGGVQWSARAVTRIAGERTDLAFLSPDKRWGQVITVAGMADVIDGVTTEIIGLIVGAYRSRKIW